MIDKYDQDLILGYVEGELDDAQRADFEATLENDHELRNLVSQLKLDRENLRSLAATTAPVGLIDQVIQTHERNALLGDPDAPEPLPLTLPVNRRRVRRVLAYAGVAAVLLISAALVIPTLMPSDLLDKPGTLALDTETTRPIDSAVPDTGSGLAMVDEDAVYDKLDARALSRAETAQPEPSGGSALAKADAARAGDTPVGSAVNESPVLADADAGAPADDSVTKPAPPTDTALAMAEHTDDTAPELTPEIATEPLRADAKEETKVADAGGSAIDTELPNAVPSLAMTSPEDIKTEAEADSTADNTESPSEPGPNPFAGYAGATRDAVTITDDTRLLINAPSPRQARRDLRNWALTNNARVTRTLEPATPDQPHGTPTLVIEIDQDKVPSLLAFFNRAPGTHARLALPADDTALAASDTQDGSDTTPTATANRMVDLNDLPDDAENATARTARANTGSTGSTDLVRGLSNAGSNPQSQSQPAEDTTTPREPQPRSDSNTGFDIGRLLDALGNKDKPEPLLQPDPATNKRVRLQVIVIQIADEPPASQPDQD